jgi:DNA-damage-inducible protein D
MKLPGLRFLKKHIRKILHEGEWWFSVIDVVEVLTGSSIPKRYWSDLKRKLAKEGYSQLYENIVQLPPRPNCTGTGIRADSSR